MSENHLFRDHAPLAFWQRPWVYGVAVTLVLAGMGVYFGWPKFKAWRVEGFLVEAAVCRQAGDLPTAEACYRSVLQLSPGDPNARVGLVQVLIDRGDFAEALRESRDTPDLWGGSPVQFIYDSLLLRQDFGRLAHFGLDRLQYSPPPAGQWLKVALDSAEIAGVVLPSAHLDATDAVIVQAHGSILKEDPALAREQLAQLSLTDLDYRRGLLVFSLQLRLDDPASALLVLGRIRHHLNSFELAMANYRLENASDPWLGDAALRQLLPLADSLNRRAVVIANLIENGSAAQAQLTLDLWIEILASQSLEEIGNAWALAQCFGLPMAAELAERYRKLSGVRLPRLVGEGLRSPDPAQRSRAVAMLARQISLSRQVAFALHLKDRRGRATGNSPSQE